MLTELCTSWFGGQKVLEIGGRFSEVVRKCYDVCGFKEVSGIVFGLDDSFRSFGGTLDMFEKGLAVSSS